MPLGYQETRLWSNSLANRSGDPHEKPRARLKSAYFKLRERAAILAGEVPQDMRLYTVHDVTHLDALWELADTICGPEIHLTPTEAFVLGGAMMLHDLGMGLAAWPNGRADLEANPGWLDVVAAAFARELGRPATMAELAAPPSSVLEEATETLLRELHAKQGERLGMISWRAPGSGDLYHLIEDTDLRNRFGSLIGQIAASHGWSLEDVVAKFGGEPIGAPIDAPDDWTVDVLKLACMLRVADAAHLDERRAPGFLRAVRQPSGYSDLHWAFQGFLQRPRRDDDRLIYTSARPFPQSDANAWWLCYESLTMVDGELRTVDAVLAERGRRRFAARHVKGVEFPTSLAEMIPTDGWVPVDASIRVSDVPSLVRQLGGESLYGDKPYIAIRELMQNARDASSALSKMIDAPLNPIVVRLEADETGEETWLSVEDSGIGMSKEVMTGALLDFGNSYWGSQLMRAESPGLAGRGFSAIGRFGIGFFSVFMLGDEVQVISRRFDEAAADTRVLHFAAGTVARPLLRPATGAETRYAGGTTVRVRLRHAPDGNDGILVSPSGETVTTLERLVAYLAPSADIDIDVSTGTQSHRVVAASDWVSIEASDLLRRLAPFDESVFGRPGELLEVTAERMTLLEDGGCPVARLALAGYPPSVGDGDRRFDTTALLTIGGFNTLQRIGGVAGLITASPTTADRMNGKPLVEPEQWTSWATDQATRVRDRYNAEVSGDGYTEWGMTLNLLANLGASLDGLFLARDMQAPLTREALISWMAQRERVVLLADWAVDFTRGADGLEHAWDRENHVEIHLKPDVLAPIDGGGRYGDWDLLPDPRPDKSIRPPEGDVSAIAMTRRWFYNMQREVEGVLLCLLAEAWDVDLIDLLTTVEPRTAGAEVLAAVGATTSEDVLLTFTWIATRPE